MADGFAAGDWIERLAQLLPPLAQAQGKPPAWAAFSD